MFAVIRYQLCVRGVIFAKILVNGICWKRHSMYVAKKWRRGTEEKNSSVCGLDLFSLYATRSAGTDLICCQRAFLHQPRQLLEITQ